MRGLILELILGAGKALGGSDQIPEAIAAAIAFAKSVRVWKLEGESCLV